jgi:hypothetical protein
MLDKLDKSVRYTTDKCCETMYPFQKYYMHREKCYIQNYFVSMADVFAP